MNKNRARTQRRMKARQALSSRYSPSGERIRKTRQEVRMDQMASVYAERTSLPLDFEIQRPDKTGRWRKAPGVPRVHTFGLARLRASKVSGPTRVRNIRTGDVW